jgi:hypothetical protein
MTQNGPAVGSAATNFGIVAWIVYGVLSGNGHWIGAAIGALAVACAIVAHEYSKSAVKIMNCTTMAFFAFALVTTIAVGPWLFKSYNIWLTWAVFAVVAWTTLLIGFPFTIQYAREQAPREIWDHHLFHRLNVILTVVFGLIFTINSGLGLIALKTGYLLSLGLIVPVALLTAGMVFSAVYPKRYASHFAPGATAALPRTLGAND